MIQELNSSPFFADAEYITLRLLRRFLFRNGLLARVPFLLPYYKPSENETSPSLIVDRYIELCASKGLDLLTLSILEIGPGRTNSVGFEFMMRGARSYRGFEPLAPFAARADEKMRRSIQDRCGLSATFPFAAANRVKSLDAIEEKSIDVVLSNSVLEHVQDLPALIVGLKRILRHNGSMVHIVDYRDHFFKYPFHFLLFSPEQWHRFLSPGDLTRQRLRDHVKAFTEQGFRVEVLDREYDFSSFSKVKGRIHKSFVDYTEDELAVTSSAFYVRAGS